MISFSTNLVNVNPSLEKLLACRLTINFHVIQTNVKCNYERPFHVFSRGAATSHDANSNVMEHSVLLPKPNTANQRSNRIRKNNLSFQIDLEQVLSLLEEEETRSSLTNGNVTANKDVSSNVEKFDEYCDRVKLLNQIFKLPPNVSEKIYFLLPEERTRFHRSNKFVNSFTNQLYRFLKENNVDLCLLDWDALKDSVKSWMSRQDMRHHSEFHLQKTQDETLAVPTRFETSKSNTSVQKIRSGAKNNNLSKKNNKLGQNLSSAVGNNSKNTTKIGDSTSVELQVQVGAGVDDTLNAPQFELTNNVVPVGRNILVNDTAFKVPKLIFSDLYKFVILSVLHDITEEDVILGVSQLSKNAEVTKIEFFFEAAGRDRRKNVFVSVKTKEQCDEILSDSIRCFGVYIKGQRSPILDASEKRVLLVRTTPAMDKQEIQQLLNKLGLDQESLPNKNLSGYLPPTVGKRASKINQTDIFVPISSTGKPMNSSYLTFANHSIAYTAYHSFNRCHPSYVTAYWTQKKNSLLEQVIKDRDTLARENMILKSKLKNGFYVNRSLKDVINSHIENVYHSVGKDATQAAQILSISQKKVLDTIKFIESDGFDFSSDE